MTGYEVFCLYNSLKLHFSTDSYDYFKYQGKSRISIESFENRKDKYYFYKLSRRNEKEDCIEFLISNFLCEENMWVGKLFEEDAMTRHRDRMKIIQALTYNFTNDCKYIRENCENTNELFKTNGDYPKLLTMTLQKDVQLETLCIMNSLMNFFPMWSKRITDTIRWPEFNRKCLKYLPFIHFECDKMKSILLKEFA